MAPMDFCFSAPFEARDHEAACFTWDAYTPFQPLLGFDAQMSACAAHLRAHEQRVLVLAAPEVLSAGLLMPIRGENHVCSQQTRAVHFRFGPLMTPGLLKGAANIAIVAENAGAGAVLGQHPFAGCTTLPAGIAAAAAYHAGRPALHRAGGSPLTPARLPGHLLHDDISAARNDRQPPAGAARVQSCESFDGRFWQRSPAPPPDTAAALPADRPAVLLPWNLAHIGSLVPDLLAKASLLALQERLPITLLVMPYNDVPWARADFAATVTSLRHIAAPEHAVLFARAATLDAGLRLASACRVAWIDASDPEAAWTAGRLRHAGLPATLLPPATFADTEIIWQQRQTHFGTLARRGAALSVRGLARLAAAAMDRHAPLPATPAPQPNRFAFHDLLAAAGIAT